MTIQQQLKRCGAVLVRQRKHQIWRLPNGRNFVMAATPSDWRAAQKQIHDLRRLLRVKGGQDGKGA